MQKFKITYRALFILFAIFVSVAATPSFASGFSQYKNMTLSSHQNPHIRHVSYRGISYCQHWRVKCRKTWNNNLDGYTKCLVYHGCAEFKVEEPDVKIKAKKTPAPQRSYARRPSRYTYNSHSHSYRHKKRRHTHRRTHSHRKRHYKRRYYHRPKRVSRKRRHTRYHSAMCRKYHSQCIRNWGTSYKNYFGCMQFHSCKPRYYKPKARYKHYGHKRRAKRHYRPKRRYYSQPRYAKRRHYKPKRRYYSQPRYTNQSHYGHQRRYHHPKRQYHDSHAYRPHAYHPPYGYYY